MHLQTDFAQKLYHIVQTQRMPHATLLIGTEGSEVLSVALDLATYIHCCHKSSLQSCGTCISCTKMKKFIHPDFHVVFPMGTNLKAPQKTSCSDNPRLIWHDFLKEHQYPSFYDWCTSLGNETGHVHIGKEQIHHMRKMLSQKPFESDFKVILIWLPEKMHPVAANAMLKTVEEPSPHTFFFFVTHRPNHVLPTLASRMWAIPMPQPDVQQTLLHFKKIYPQIDECHIAQAVHVAKDNMNLAHKLLQECQESYFTDFVTWMRSIYAQNMYKIVQCAEKFHDETSFIQRHWVTYALQLLRNVFMYHLALAVSPILTEEECLFCQKFSKTITAQQLETIVEQLAYLDKVLARKAQAKLAFLHVSLNMLAMFQQKDPKSLHGTNMIH